MGAQPGGRGALLLDVGPLVLDQLVGADQMAVLLQQLLAAECSGPGLRLEAPPARAERLSVRRSVRSTVRMCTPSSAAKGQGAISCRLAESPRGAPTGIDRTRERLAGRLDRSGGCGPSREGRACRSPCNPRARPPTQPDDCRAAVARDPIM